MKKKCEVMKMKKILCVALLFVCTAFTACGSENDSYNGFVEDNGDITYFDNANVTLKVVTPPPTEESYVEPTNPPLDIVPAPAFIEDGTVYTLTITGVEYTGTITEIIEQLPVKDNGTYFIHIQNVCAVVTDAYNLPKVLLDAAKEIIALNTPEEYTGFVPTISDAQEVVDIFNGARYFITDYEVLAAYHKDDMSYSYLPVDGVLYINLENNTYNFISATGDAFDIEATNLEEAYAWCETGYYKSNDVDHWTYFK